MVRSPLPPWKASLEPSGDQAGKLALFVRLWRPEPSALITEMPTPETAICVPSGDQAGSQTNARRLHPVMLQVTPLWLGSFAPVAVKSWLPLVRRLALAGTTATEIAGPPPPGAVVSEPHAARTNRLNGVRSRRGTEGVFMI